MAVIEEEEEGFESGDVEKPMTPGRYTCFFCSPRRLTKS